MPRGNQLFRPTFDKWWTTDSIFNLPSAHLCNLVTLCSPCSRLDHGQNQRSPFFCCPSQGVCQEDNQLLSNHSNSRSCGGWRRSRSWRCRFSKGDITHALVNPPHHGVWSNPTYWSLENDLKIYMTVIIGWYIDLSSLTISVSSLSFTPAAFLELASSQPLQKGRQHRLGVCQILLPPRVFPQAGNGPTASAPPRSPCCPL